MFIIVLSLFFSRWDPPGGAPRLLHLENQVDLYEPRRALCCAQHLHLGDELRARDSQVCVPGRRFSGVESGHSMARWAGQQPLATAGAMGRDWCSSRTTDHYQSIRVMANSGCFWRLLAIFDHFFWSKISLIAFHFCHFWTFIWFLLASFGCFWLLLVAFGWLCHFCVFFRDNVMISFSIPISCNQSVGFIQTCFFATTDNYV